MPLYALDDIDDAIEATTALLWPFNRGVWARLAVIVFFLGGTGGANPFQFASSPPSGGGTPPPSGAEIPGSFPSIGAPELAVIGGIVALVLLVAVVFMLIGSVMEFAFVESLSQERVTIRRYWSEHWRRGIRLFGFRLVLGVGTLAIIGLLVALVAAPLLLGRGEVSIGLALVAVPVGIAVAIASGLVNGFTTMFVVPIMLREGRGVIAGWRRFWPTMLEQWKQYAAYAVMGFILQLAGGIAAGIATLVGALVLAIPVALLGLLGWGLLGVAELVGWAVIVIAIVAFVVFVVVLAVLASVPVETFLRYYALLVLGDTNEAFDLVAERRSAIRS